MSQRNQPDTTGGLAKLPIDVLLHIFDGCDVVDILNLASTCKELRTATEERQVWLTQFKRRCGAFRQAPFNSRVEDLHVHSTAQLKSWIIQQARTDAHWLQNKDADGSLEFQSIRINDPEDVQYEYIFLLPGGEHLVVLTGRKDIILKKIERENDTRDSVLVLADVVRRSLPRLEYSECPVKIFTDTICEYPLITYHNPGNASITIFLLDHDSRTISVQKEIQRDPRDELADYRMEDISIRGDTIMWFYTDGDGESRKCLIVAKLDDPDSTATKHFDLGWDAWTPEVSHFKVLTANAFIRYDHEGIYIHHIPHPPSGIQLHGGNNRPPPPSIVWSYHYGDSLDGYSSFYYSRTDAVLPNFCFHNTKDSHIIEFGMDALADAQRGQCAGYPVVLNHTVIPANGDPPGGMDFQRVNGRKGARFYFDPLGNFALDTVLLDNPNRCGRFRGNLKQLGFLDAHSEWIQVAECDEITGRVLLLFDGLIGHDLLLVDLPSYSTKTHH